MSLPRSLEAFFSVFGYVKEKSFTKLWPSLMMWLHENREDSSERGQCGKTVSNTAWGVLLQTWCSDLNPAFCVFLLSCVFSINISGTFTTRPGSLRFLQSVLSYSTREAEYLTVNKNYWATLVTLRMEMQGKSWCVATTTRVAGPLADWSVS